MNLVADALAALEFLTVLRVRPSRHAAGAEALAGSVAFFPFVGLLVGLLVAGLDRALREILPLPAESAVIVAVLVALTGGLHLDGLADSFDGLLGGRDRDARLRIMRDPSTGAFGAAAVAMVLVIDTFALASIPGGPWRTGSLILAPILSRGAMALVMAAFPCARPEGLAVSMHRHAGRAAPLIAASMVAACFGTFAFGGLGAGGLAVAAAFVVALWGWRAAGGLTGDLYGAVCELSQAAVLLGLASGAEMGWLEPSRILQA